MLFKRLVAFFITLTLCLSLAACNSENTSDNTSASEEVTTTQPSDQTTEPTVDEFIPIIENGSTEYKVIRADGASQVIINSLQLLSTNVKNSHYLNLSLNDDWVKGLGKGEVYESDNPEILIGNTNRKESKDIISALNPGEYTIAVVGNKLVLAGYSDYLTYLAVAEFVEQFINSSAERTLKLPKDLSIMKKAEVTTVGDTDATVRIMTFNVLGTSENYENRIPHILSTINTYKPGIIGFQECNKKQHTEMVEKLDGYAVACKLHANGSTYVYTPIVYRTDKYELVDAGVEWLDSRYTGTNTKSIGWAVLKDIFTGDVFGVINIHGSLWSDSYTPPSGKTHEEMFAAASVAWKEDNIRQMKDCMQKLITEYGDIPILWLGDFNFNSNHSAYTKATNEYGMHEAEITATVSKMTGTKTTHGVGSAPANGLSIDHVFGNSKVTFRVHHVCKSGDELKASDHCAVFADLLFNK